MKELTFSSVQSLSHVQLFAPWTAARQASLSITSSWNLLRLLSSWWCHPAVSSSIVPFSSCLQSLPAQGVFQWVSSSHQVSSFGYNLAPLLFKERKGKDFKGKDSDRPFRIGRVHREINIISSTLERVAAVNRRRKIVCGMQVKKQGVLRHWMESERSCGLFPRYIPIKWKWLVTRRKAATRKVIVCIWGSKLKPGYKNFKNNKNASNLESTMCRARF